jgi:hypothetical protein
MTLGIRFVRELSGYAHALYRREIDPQDFMEWYASSWGGKRVRHPKPTIKWASLKKDEKI